MTHRVALIGNPLRRRHSEVMHNAAFEHFDIDAVYELRELTGEELAAFCEEVRDGPWLGFQVTAPHKQAAVEYLDGIDDVASGIGAVNSVIKLDRNRLLGFNTDAPGFRRAAEGELGVRLRGLNAVVAGAGGAARAVVHALVWAGAASITVGNRTGARARDLAGAFGESVSAAELGGPFEEALHNAQLAVNATTVGMHTPGIPFDVGALPQDCAVYDLIYSPPATELLLAAQARGLRTANGLGMLVAQAEIAFERWTGVVDAGSVMRAALTQL